MTREDILAMDSTELRVEVAEKIFRAKVTGKDFSEPPLFLIVGDKGAGWVPISGKRWQNADWHYSEEAAWNDCPEYAESIQAAWEVVEKMRPTHVYELADFGRNTHNAKQHFAAFNPINEPRDYERQVRAKTLAEAICKAALIAVMEGKDEGE